MVTMSTDPTLFIGVDPCGGRKPFTYAALDQSGRLIVLKDGEVEDVQAFIAGQSGAIVAVNAPQRPSIGLVQQDKIAQNPPAMRVPSRGLAMRLAEQQLHEHGINIAPTPARKELCAHWVQAGFDFYRRLEGLGFLPHPTPGTSRQWLETHPHAVFCVLLGQVPLARPTLEGRQQRQLALYEQRLGIRDPMEFFEEITRHKLLKGALPIEQIYTAEELDALAAAYMAYVAGCHPGRIGTVGDSQEGQICLPVRELKTKY